MTISLPSLRDDGKLKFSTSIAFWTLVPYFGYQIADLTWRYVKWWRRTSPLFTLPGPTNSNTSFVLGQFVITAKESFLRPHLDWWRAAREEKAKRDKNGDDNIPLLHYTSAFGRSYVAILEPSLVQKIVIAPLGIEKPPIVRDVALVRSILGDGLLMLEGPEWRRHRHILQPAFTASAINEALPSSVQKHVKKFTRYWMKAGDREVNVFSHFSALTLDILGEVAFSHSFGGLQSVRKWADMEEEAPEGILTEVQDPLIQALRATFKLDFVMLLLFFTGFFGLNKYVNPNTILTRQKLNKAVDDIIEEAEKDFDASENKPISLPKKSILHLLLQARYNDKCRATSNDETDSKYAPPSDHSLSNMEIRDEITSFIIAGHETTSSLLHWAIFAMIKFPEVQQRVHDDIVKYAGSAEDISLECIEKMEYFNAFMMEVLRLYPPGSLLIRSTRYDDKYGDFNMPAGSNIIVFPFLLHRHPTYWDDPETFCPERWIDCKIQKRPDGTIVKDETAVPYKHRFAYIPFSAGSRNCIGQRFATVEAKMIMASLIRAFSFSLAPSQRETEFSFDMFITMTTKPSLRVCLTPRVFG